MTNYIHIKYDGMRPYLQEAVIKTNELLRSNEFYDWIAACEPFDLADISPETIAALMRKACIDMTVELYYSMSPIKNIDGFDDLEKPHLIHLNIWKIDRPVASLCNSLVHSCVHAVNAKNGQYSFGHGDMSVKGKALTAPYRIGEIAERMISQDDAPFITMQHDIIEVGMQPIKDYMVAL